MERFFVYGSLREGMYNYVRYLKGRIIKNQQGFVKGELYTIKGVVYPALLSGEHFIAGEIMQIQDTNIWKELDELESYHGEGNVENEYHKVMMDIYDEHKVLVEQLPVYMFNMDKPSHKNILNERILSGDYVAYMKQKMSSND